jgi:hypothetical protein
MSNNFTVDHFLQVIVSSQSKGSTYYLQTEFTERVLYPADSEKIIAVGTTQSSFGTLINGKQKPDLLMPSPNIEFTLDGVKQP